MIHRNILLFLFLTVVTNTTLSAQPLNPIHPSTPCAVLSALPDTLSFPIIPLSTDSSLSLLIKNTGDLLWTPNTPLIFPNNGAFTILGFDTNSIPPGGSKKVMVKFTPQSAGKDSAKITFPDAGPCGNNLTIYLYGEGGCAHVSSPDSVISDTTNSSESIIFTIRINNSGNYVWYPRLETITGKCKNAFKVIGIVPDLVMPGQSATLTAECNFSDIGECCAVISFADWLHCSNPLSIYMCGVRVKSDVKGSTNSDGFSLDQNFPNPFTSKTSFNYSTPKETELNIVLCDLMGKRIRTLTSGRVSEGKHLLNFDASDLPSGTYIYVLESGSTRLSRELILTK